jgi:hypothetical protein
MGSICSAAPEDQIDNSIKNLRTYTLHILHTEINKSISQKYGTDFAFNPKKVCEINGNSLSIEGILFKDHTTKNIRVNLEKDNSDQYKVVRVSEIQ